MGRRVAPCVRVRAAACFGLLQPPLALPACLQAESGDEAAGAQLSWANRLAMLHDVAAGMAFLHAQVGWTAGGPPAPALLRHAPRGHAGLPQKTMHDASKPLRRCTPCARAEKVALLTGP